ncbi:M3 family metallopeptidase [Massilia sp. BJB1822]|uniref:M3 family metallopeptidase n=1 Tax=Massilia sp. BJB1822 TaxID=2744470 RepID=UPI001E4AE4BD|nr:M3 family metallopeptidase [Massilia sp. BJB1822]
MSHPRMLVLAASLGLALTSMTHAAPATKPAAATAAAAANPLFKASTLPLQYPAFDQIKDEHFAPAFKAAMAENLKEIAAIANNPQPATFDNTIVAMERSGEMLHRVQTIFGNLQGANTNDKLDEISRSMSPKLAAHSDAIFLNAKLFLRVQSLYAQRDKLGLDAEAAHLLERYHTDFLRSGAQLSAAQKAKLKTLNAQIASLQTAFDQNVLKETNASALVLDSRADLAGLSEAAIDAAAAEAKSRKLPGKFVLPLMNTTSQPALGELTNPAIRARLLKASMERGSHGGKYDNREVVRKLAKLRAEQAVLLGYADFASYSLEEETAKNPAAVNKLLSELAKPAADNARREAADLQAVAGGKIAASDWDFYTDKVRAQRFAFDEKQLKPYFELDSVLINGVFYAAGKLYGLSFKERKDLPVYNPDVRVFDVFDADGKQLAIFLADMYARSNKQGGAWMNEYVSQSKLNGTLPVVANHLNIPKPPAGEPTLLTVDEVKTAFHEFGHALHGMFSNVTYPRFSGTSVPRDFVEYPSQVNEMWMDWPEVLANYAKHYQTGEPMPKELLDKVRAAKKFNQGFATTEYLAASLLDQRWHQIKPAQVPSDVLGFEAAALKEAGVDLAEVPPRYRTTYFNHSFAGGYSAGYYAYLWSEQLDADTVEWFKENGGLQRKNGDWFRQTLLSRGGTADALQLFRDFRGRDAKIEPLLERRGLNAK